MRVATYACLLFLAACSTPYKEYGFYGGLSEVRLAKNAFKVSFQGNMATSMRQATDFTLLRCAELTRENGYQFFTIVSELRNDNEFSGGIHTVVKASGDGAYASSVNPTYKQPSTENTILMFAEKPDTEFAYEAKYVIDSVTQQYQIDGLGEAWDL